MKKKLLLQERRTLAAAETEIRAATATANRTKKRGPGDGRAGGRAERGRLIHRKDYCYRVFFYTGRLEIQR
jgi:hypothetical protein